jgi:hypothetical protein
MVDEVEELDLASIGLRAPTPTREFGPEYSICDVMSLLHQLGLIPIWSMKKYSLAVHQSPAVGTE